VLIVPDCIPCISNMAVSALRCLPISSERQKEIFTAILEIPAFQGKSWHLTSPEIIEQVWETICRETDQRDPFLQEKELQNQRVAAILPFLQSEIEKAEDPLRKAVHLAVIGNSIDLMIDNHAADIQQTVIEGLRLPLPEPAYSAFSKKLNNSRKLVYLGDNSGEIVFDKLLMQTIRKRLEMDIHFVVRSTPTMNDVTLREATALGISEVANIVENGVDGPVPGTMFGRCSKTTKELLQSADLIISKGGGNFDAFEEDAETLGVDVSFLLLCKCHPYRRYFGQELFSPVLWNVFSDQET